MKTLHVPGLIVAVLLASLSGTKSSGYLQAAAGQDSAELLQPGSPAVRLSGNAVQFFFSLKSDDYFRLIVEKTGTDVEVSVDAPNGRLIRSLPCSKSGTIAVSDIAALSGRYGVRIRRCDAGPGRSYLLSLSSIRKATGPDRSRVAAEKLFEEAEADARKYRSDSFKSAIRKYGEAGTKWAGLQDYAEQSRALVGVSRLYKRSSDWIRSTAATEQAIQASRRAGDSVAETEALLELASIHLNQGNTPLALETGKLALAASRKNPNPTTSAEVSLLLGAILYFMDSDEGRKELERARDTFLSYGDRIGAARSTLLLAGMDSDLNHHEDAIKAGVQAREVFRQLGMREDEAKSLLTLGSLQYRAGRVQAAVNLYNEAEPLVAGSGDLIAEALVMGGLGFAQSAFGAHTAASQSFRLALARYKSLGNRMDELNMLVALGDSALSAGDLDDAIRYLEQALHISRELMDTKVEVWVLGNLGLVQESHGETQKALSYLNEALTKNQSMAEPNERLAALSLTGLGHIYEVDGDLDRALEYYNRALPLHEAAGNPFGRLNTVYRIAQTLRRKGKESESIKLLERALQEIEEMRSSVSSLEFRTTYFATVKQQYDLYIDILMQSSGGHPALPAIEQAFKASERSRVRTLLDGILETRVSITEGVDRMQVEQAEALKVRVERQSERHAALLRTGTDSRAIADAANEHARLQAQLEGLESQIRARSPRYAALVQPEILSLREIQELLGDDSVLLEYSLGEENSYLWAVTREGLTSYVLPRKSEIERDVRHLRDLIVMRSVLQNTKEIKAADDAFPQEARKLGQVLLGGVAGLIKGRRLVVVADGILQAVPFNALSVSALSEPTIRSQEVVNIPSAATLAAIRRDAPNRKVPDRTLAVIADGVFQATESRVKKSMAGISKPTGSASSTPAVNLRGDPVSSSLLNLRRLPATQMEARQILGMVPANSRMEAIGFAATKATVMGPELRDYRIVHFATHTIVNDAYPDLSSLVFSLVDERGNPLDGFLRMRDIYNLKLSADLVVLSACDTGIGREVRGEGLMSMVRGFMYSGTPRVLASLWKVDDEATAEFMVEFYRQMLENKLSPSAALRQAQITQMSKASTKAPYFWAGFQLQGEWR